MKYVGKAIPSYPFGIKHNGRLFAKKFRRRRIKDNNKNNIFVNEESENENNSQKENNFKTNVQKDKEINLKNIDKKNFEENNLNTKEFKLDRDSELNDNQNKEIEYEIEEEEIEKQFETGPGPGSYNLAKSMNKTLKNHPNCIIGTSKRKVIL